MDEIYVNPAHVNEDYVKKLNDLIEEKRKVIGLMKSVHQDVKDGAKLDMTLFKKSRSRYVNIINSDYLHDSLIANSEWVLDRVYDQAIQKIDADISKIATLILENLIEAKEIPF